MESKFDLFELKVELRGPYQVHSDEPPSYLITQAVWINGENLAPENPIDLRQLAKSCQMSGEFFIVTCGCGEAGCAGIDDGVRVTHFDDRLVWEVPVPLSYRGMTDAEAERHGNNRVYQRFNFDPNLYLATMQAGLREAKCLLFGEQQPVECSPDGFGPKDLLSLNPAVFSERGTPKGCLIIGKKVVVDRSPSWVTIDGIHFRLRQLPVPDAIRQLDVWSDWEPKACSGGYVFGDAAAPDWEVRRRKRLLGEYLASITMKGGMVFVTLRNDWEKRCKHQLVLGGRA